MGILQDLFKNRIIISLTAYNPGRVEECVVKLVSGSNALIAKK